MRLSLSGMTKAETDHSTKARIEMGKCRYDLQVDCHAKDCVKCILDKIRTEIESMDFDFGDYYDHTDEIIEMVCKVIDKYKAR